MGIVLMIHSLLRWIILIVALLAVAKYSIGLAQSAPFDKNSALLLSGFSGLLDLQALLGLIALVGQGIGGGFWPASRFIHMAIMMIAIALAHIFSRRFKSVPDRLRTRNSLLLILGVLALIVLGITLPLGAQAWNMSR